MAKKIIVIDGFIGPYGYSKQYLREMLKGSEGDEIELIVSSLGGRVDHALDMHDQIAEHGNVTVKFTGFNASAATFLPLGAKKIIISENSFYLIHKIMSGVDLYGAYNADDLDKIIEDLQTEQDENKKMDMQVAIMYSKKSGKGIKDILDLMKKDTWITAQEAKDWGFVDEVSTTSNQVNFLEDQAKVAMISASGLPSPRVATTTPVIPKKEDNNDLFTRLTNWISNNQNEGGKTSKKNKMKKQYLKVNGILNVEKLESQEDGVFLNEDQLEAIESNITQAEVDLQAAKGAQTTTEGERDTARTELINATNELDELGASVKEAKTPAEKVNAIRTLLAAKPAEKKAGVKEKKDDKENKDDADWDTINSLAHNKDADHNS